jgi:hypothetical protein
MELFGLMHIMITGTNRTLCGAIMNLNGEHYRTYNLAESVTCSLCADYARSLEIPTSK